MTQQDLHTSRRTIASLACAHSLNHGGHLSTNGYPLNAESIWPSPDGIQFEADSSADVDDGYDLQAMREEIDGLMKKRDVMGLLFKSNALAEQSIIAGVLGRHDEVEAIDAMLIDIHNYFLERDPQE